VFSLAYAIGAPVMALLTAGLERRRLLAVAMGGFALGNLLAALAPDYAGLRRRGCTGTVRIHLHAGGHWILSGKRTDERGHAGACASRLLYEHHQEENVWKGFAATVRSTNRPNGETHHG
jgi:hypothetical protein